MKFVVEQVSLSGGRLGKLSLSNLYLNTNVVHQTPMVVLTTQAGSAPNITQDVLKMILECSGKCHDDTIAPSQATDQQLSATPTLLLSVPVQHFAKQTEILQKYKKGVAAFAGLSNHNVLVTVQCALTETRSGFNERGGVSTFTRQGKVVLKPESYLRCVSSLRPCLWECLHDDDTPHDCSSKRINKSLTASLEYLEACLRVPFEGEDEAIVEGGLLVPLLGGWQPKQRRRWSEQIVAKYSSVDKNNGMNLLADEEINREVPLRRVCGYTVRGLHSNGGSAEQVPDDELLKACLEASLSPLPARQLRFAPGAYSPLTTLTLVGAGVDVLDCALACIATQRHSALCFPFTEEMRDRLKNSAIFTDEINEVKSSSTQNPSGDVNGTSAGAEEAANRKKLRSADGAAALVGCATPLVEEEEDERERPYEIKLTDQRHARSSLPLLPGCQCYTCTRGYTRSYLHYLSNVREMLAPVLLNIHNIHHWFGFMSSIRLAIADDTLPQLRDIVQSLYTGSLHSCDKVDRPGKPAVKVDTKTPSNKDSHVTQTHSNDRDELNQTDSSQTTNTDGNWGSCAEETVSIKDTETQYPDGNPLEAASSTSHSTTSVEL